MDKASPQQITYLASQLQEARHEYARLLGRAARAHRVYVRRLQRASHALAEREHLHSRFVKLLDQGLPVPLADLA